MKKIKSKWHTWVNALLTTMMGWFAASCNVPVLYGTPVEMYAPPAPEPESYLIVTGKVVDEVGRPLGNIRVGLKAPLFGENMQELYTNEHGDFGFAETFLPDVKGDTLQLYFSDVYQIYAPDSLQVPFAKMRIDSIDTDTYGYNCKVSMQLNKKEQSTE